MGDHQEAFIFCVWFQPPPDGGEGKKEGDQTEDKKQKENNAYAKKVVLRLAGLMGLGGAVSMVYVFGEWRSGVLVQDDHVEETLIIKTYLYSTAVQFSPGSDLINLFNPKTNHVKVWHQSMLIYKLNRDAHVSAKALIGSSCLEDRPQTRSHVEIKLPLSVNLVLRICDCWNCSDSIVNSILYSQKP